MNTYYCTNIDTHERSQSHKQVIVRYNNKHLQVNMVQRTSLITSICIHYTNYHVAGYFQQISWKASKDFQNNISLVFKIFKFVFLTHCTAALTSRVTLDLTATKLACI